ncbi:hypothetical protein ISN44_As06g039320 [Arabidopsis suecica]|uniref:Uncharacterized protein n=1 Tax=Arabidopsis suecica TaxID=45249 RepID=A0A8T2CH97_ARASU|nr:hypothetical protein ISN44_As06g039320 [Arabidopsis suecica]
MSHNEVCFNVYHGGYWVKDYNGDLAYLEEVFVDVPPPSLVEQIENRKGRKPKLKRKKARHESPTKKKKASREREELCIVLPVIMLDTTKKSVLMEELRDTNHQGRRRHLPQEMEKMDMRPITLKQVKQHKPVKQHKTNRGRLLVNRIMDFFGSKMIRLSWFLFRLIGSD